MSAKKERVPIVVDTNVFVRNFLSRNRTSANKKVIRLWLLEKKLQLIVSNEIINEYLEIFEEILGFNKELVDKWRSRLEKDPRTTLVNLVKSKIKSRDPDDNMLLQTALAGKVQYLVTNDKDLLEIPLSEQRKLAFVIVRPDQFLNRLEEQS